MKIRHILSKKSKRNRHITSYDLKFPLHKNSPTSFVNCTFETPNQNVVSSERDNVVPDVIMKPVLDSSCNEEPLQIDSRTIFSSGDIHKPSKRPVNIISPVGRLKGQARLRRAKFALSKPLVSADENSAQQLHCKG